MYDLVKKKERPADSVIEWIPYSRITNLEKIAEGGFGIIYQATWEKPEKTAAVIVKRFKFSQNISKYFLNEV